MINLHIKTSKGSFDSIIRNSDLMNLTDNCISVIDDTMFNVVDFYKECVANGKKSIIGLDVCESFGNVEALIQNYGKFYGRLSLIARGYTGYQNLVRISTFSNKYGYYQKPRVDLERLAKYKSGIICLIDSINSVLSYHILNNNMRQAYIEIKELKNIFGANLYCVVYANERPNDKVISFMKQNMVPIVASNVVRYIDKEDKVYWNYIKHIYENILMDQSIDSKFYHYCNANDFLICDWIGDIEISNTYEILNEIGDYHLDKREQLIPDMEVYDVDFVDYLYDKLDEFGLHTKEYVNRLNYELNVIMKYGYKDYFLLVEEVIEYAKNSLSGYISAGRGSVGGCLIAYLMGITRIDPVNPIGFDLQIPFDRFLNAGRKVMPDIDLDFLPRDRQAVIQYLKDKYGDNSVKNMMTVVTFAARSSIREVCRISGTLDTEMELLLKSFPTDQQLNLDVLKETDIYKQNLHNDNFIGAYNIAKKIEGLARNIGVHASGIALSNVSMDGLVPMFVHNEREVTQYDQDSLDYMGIVKLDILGLNALQIVSDCLDIIGIKMDKGEWLSDISVDDNDVYQFINSGNITGVFQWDTYNYRKVIEMVKPKNFKELVDLNTLGRSAALLSGLTDKYVARKNKLEVIEPLHPLLYDLMEQTYKLPLYQEQLMAVFVELAGFTITEADDVRKAIGKKIPELMQIQMDKFIEGCEKKNGIKLEEANNIWSIIDKFSKYTWNLGHAMAYTRICYETAYLAYYYPKEYYCACINNSDNSDTAGDFISTLKKRGIQVNNCDINLSEENFVIKDKQVYAGFGGLKYFKDKRIKALLDLRGTGFESIKDFCERVPKKLVNKQAIESLLCAGAFDNLIQNKDDTIILADRIGYEWQDILTIRYDQYKKCGRIATSIDKLAGVNYDKIEALAELKSVQLPMYVAKIKEIYTKNGKKMAFTVLEDETGRYEVTWFPDSWKSNKLKVGNLYLVTLEHRNGIFGINAKDF